MQPAKLLKPLALALIASALTTSMTSCTREGVTRGGSGQSFEVVQHASRKTLKSFDNEGDLRGFLVDLAKAQAAERERWSKESSNYPQAEASAAPEAPAQPTTAAAADGEESVTNVQTAGVDEGGIVKVHGDQLVVLRRGRLFTVKIGGGDLAPISTVDAYGPGIDPNGTWYDEMLVSDDTVVVIGYSYARGGTEVGLFDITKGGELSYKSTYHLRSNDYYSSRNYASRLVGNHLIFYTPLYLNVTEDDPFTSFPALRKWHEGATDKEWRRITSATHVYRPILASGALALHTVTVCDLEKAEMDCEATAVFGPEGRVFYVSQSSVFVWMTEWETEEGQSRPKSLLYRMPLNGSDPSVLRVAGAPIDQFSFLEDKDGFLNVLVTSDGAGDAMWGPENAGGKMAALRVKLESFGDGSESAPLSAYTMLPVPTGYTYQNRFVGDYLLYGAGSGWGEADPNAKLVYAFEYREPETKATKLDLGHGVDRIEALGGDAIVIGTDGKDLHFSPIRLSGDRPTLGKRYTRASASQGEMRSHGFFYKPDGKGSGMLGLPIREAGAPGYEHLFNESASILFLRNDDLVLSELGTLKSKPENAADDDCKASCVDWYGNARPLFFKGRIFALLGYELVEGKVDNKEINETQRVSFAPSRKRVAR
ncbi:MAG: beta-propeller domain-containing protein [Polyangiaceae bacterium]